MASNVADEKWMNAALGLARRGLGSVAPNPAVGCLLVKDGKVVGRGWTQPGGRPHAETEALARAGDSARGATAYVTLEPCAHTGVTGPCAVALTQAGISRCVIATGDPDPRVAGQGVRILEEHGIQVDMGVCKAEANALNEGFFTRVTQKRPAVTLKIASTLDGRIALENGESKWITGPAARRYGHLLRATHDAILVGVNTVIADDPSLDCRLAGLEACSPVPVILDSSLRTGTNARLVTDAQERGTLLLHVKRDAEKEKALSDLGVTLAPIGDTRDMPKVLTALAERGVTRLLVEGGGQVHASFLKAGVADRVEHFIAGKVIGGDGRPAIGDLGLASLVSAPHLTREGIRHLGPDMLASYVKAE